MYKERIQEENQLQAYTGALVCDALLFFSGSPTDKFNTLVSERFTENHEKEICSRAIPINQEQEKTKRNVWKKQNWAKPDDRNTL